MGPLLVPLDVGSLIPLLILQKQMLHHGYHRDLFLHQHTSLYYLHQQQFLVEYLYDQLNQHTSHSLVDYLHSKDQIESLHLQ
ncbi:hypothetical protein D3C79_1007080 [compost metagenome]